MFDTSYGRAFALGIVSRQSPGLRKGLAVLAALAGLLGAPSSAAASIIFDSLGGSYTSASGIAYDGPSGYADQAIGSSFTVGPQDYTLERIGLVLWPGAGASGQTMTLDLRADEGGAPGAVLESFVVAETDITYNALLLRNSLLAPVLSANTTYWLTATPSLGFNAAWAFNNTGATGLAVATTAPFTAWNVFAGDASHAMRIEGTELPPPAAVPEPSTLLLLGTGIAASAWRQRRAR